MTRKIITKSTQIHRKSVKIEAWTGPGDSWGGLGSHFGSQGLPGTAKRGQMAKMCPKMGPHLGIHFPHFRYFLIYFCALFSRLRFGSYFSRFSLNLGVILESFLQLFRASLKCAGKGSRSSPSLSEHYLEAPVFTLFRIIFRTSVPTPVFLTFSSILASISATILEPKSQTK